MKFNYNFYVDTPQSTIDLFEKIISTKYDLEEIAYQSLDMEIRFNTSIQQNIANNLELSKTALWLRKSRPSYISAAYCYNNYVDAFVTDSFYDHFEKYDECKISMGLRSAQVIIELHNTLISIKSGLDRLVSIFSEYYRGISKNVTFGHKKIKIDGTVSYTSFLSFCYQMKDKDEVFSYILSEYEKWIANCVEPRDAVVHYGDFFNLYEFFADGCTEMPISINQSTNENLEINIRKLQDYVEKYYVFMNNIIKHLWRIELASVLNNNSDNTN